MSSPAKTGENNKNRDQIDELPTQCCGCFPIRIGVFVLILLSLGLLVYGLVSDVILRSNSRDLRTQYPNDVVGYIFTGIRLVIYLGMLLGAIKRSSKLYRPFAQVNLAFFWLWVVLGIGAIALTWPKFGAESVPLMLSFAFISYMVAGYWAWILWKYADVLAKEELERAHKEGMIV